MTTYRHTQVGTYLIAGLTALAVVLGVAGGLLGTLRWMLPAMALLALIVALFGSLTTEIADRELRCRFGIGLIHKRFELRGVVRVETVRNSWIWGWGIRYTPRGWLYNVSGLQAVELTLRGGRRVRIGTDEPEELARAIRQALEIAPFGG